MIETIILVLIIFGTFGLIGWLSVFHQRRFNLNNNLMMPRVNQRFQAIAIVSPLLFGLIYFVEITFVYSFRKPEESYQTS